MTTKQNMMNRMNTDVEGIVASFLVGETGAKPFREMLVKGEDFPEAYQVVDAKNACIKELEELIGAFSKLCWSPSRAGETVVWNEASYTCKKYSFFENLTTGLQVFRWKQIGEVKGLPLPYGVKPLTKKQQRLFRREPAAAWLRHVNPLCEYTSCLFRLDTRESRADFFELGKPFRTYDKFRCGQFNTFPHLWDKKDLYLFHSDCTVVELRKTCKMNGLKGYSKLKKRDLFTLLMTI
jgi:hypothetical protein